MPSETPLDISPRRYCVYVFELDDAVCKRTNCPARAAGKPHLHVGSAAKPPDLLEAHHGIGATPTVVAKYGVRLRPRLYKNLGPYSTRDEAREAATLLAERLRKRNFHVYGGH
jgi:hypothetical protein